MTAEGKLGRIHLNDYKGKYVVLLMYPADFTFVCPTEIIAYSDAADKFAVSSVASYTPIFVCL